jgi:hypothetical protein
MTRDERIMLYLAECIAATAHDFDKKSAPRGKRQRHRRLCLNVAGLLDGTRQAPLYRASREEVANRLQDMAVALAKYDPTPDTP